MASSAFALASEEAERRGGAGDRGDAAPSEEEDEGWAGLLGDGELRDTVEELRRLVAANEDRAPGEEDDDGDLREVSRLRHRALDAFQSDCSADDEDYQDAERAKLLKRLFDSAQELVFARSLRDRVGSLERTAAHEYGACAGLLREKRGAAPAEAGDEGGSKRARHLPDFMRNMTMTALEDGENNTPFTKLLLHVQFNLRTRGWRRYNDRIWKPIRVGGVRTWAWRDSESLEGFVYSICRKAINPYMWRIAAQPSRPVKAVVEYFRDSGDPEFPPVRRAKHIFSFRNGVFDAASLRFRAYSGSMTEEEESEFLGGLSPATHVDLEFPAEEHGRLARGEMDWWEVETAGVEKIFGGQLQLPGKEKRPDPAAMRMVYVMSGRLFHDMNEHDNWGVVPMIVGTAGTGKSTFANFLMDLWEDGDVGVLSNNCERQFALSAFFDKYLFVAPEVKQDLKLDQAEWQSMTTGDPTSCAIKHKTAVACRWKVPSWFMGNQVPGWVDHSGSAVRRLLLFRFPDRVQREEGDLPAQLKAEKAAFVLKSAFAYMWMVDEGKAMVRAREAAGEGVPCGAELSRRHAGRASLWNWLREHNGYFWRERTKLTAQLNPLESFIQECLVDVAGEHVTFDEFKRRLREHCRDNNFDTYRMVGDGYMTIFGDHGYEVRTVEHVGHSGAVRSVKAVVGCRWRVDESDEPAGGGDDEAGSDIDD